MQHRKNSRREYGQEPGINTTKDHQSRRWLVRLAKLIDTFHPLSPLAAPFLCPNNTYPPSHDQHCSDETLYFFRGCIVIACNLVSLRFMTSSSPRVASSLRRTPAEMSGQVSRRGGAAKKYEVTSAGSSFVKQIRACMYTGMLLWLNGRSI